MAFMNQRAMTNEGPEIKVHKLICNLKLKKQ